MATDSEQNGVKANAVSQLSPSQQRELLAELLRQKAEKAEKARREAVAPHTEASLPFPMSEGQQGLWHAYRRDPNSASFNVFLPTRLRSALDLDALRRSVELLAERHPALRTVFSDSDGQLTQRIDPNAKPEFRVIDLPGGSDEEARQRIARETLRPFDLEQGPLLRVLAVRLSPDDYIVVSETHHIVVDFWSLVLLLDEIRQTYPAFAAGQIVDQGPTASNYADFVQAQKQFLESEKGAQQREFWQKTIQGASMVVEVPTDFRRPNQFTERAANQSLEFSPGISSRITEIARKQRATPFAVVQSALQVLISAYSGQKTFFIGSPFSGRSQRSFERTTGFFVNMVPLKADLDGHPSFLQLIGKNTQTLFDALEHEAYPISHIVNDAGVPRDPSRSPLFQVSCTFEKSHLKAEAGRAAFLFPGTNKVWDFGGIQQESFYVPVQTCHYDLEFILEQTENELRGMICYCKDLFSEATAAHIADNFKNLFDRLLEHPDQPVDQVRLCDSPGDEPCYRDTRPRTTVDRLLYQSAEQHPSCEAIRFRSQSCSFQEYGSAAFELAQQLRRLGVSSGDRVPILSRRGPQAVVAMLAIQQLGAAFVPIDAGQPPMAVEDLLNYVGAKVMVSDSPSVCPAESSSSSVAQVALPSWDDIASSSADSYAEPSPAHDRDHVAYVVYTSGSTGKPKGVMVDHGAVCNTLLWRQADVPLQPGDRVLMPLSHQFDAGLVLAWTTLTQGATLVIADEDDLRDPNQLLDLLIREHINVLPAPPSLLGMIVAHPRFPELAQNLKYVWTGGEVLPPTLPAQIREHTSARIFNFYGPTEAAIEATFCEVTHHDPRMPVSIGSPITNTDILILDERKNVVPPTIPGEIAISGAGLALGYLGAEELTNAKFVHLPGFARQAYLTGDRGRINAHGQVEFLGRTDHQIKLRGYRIELGEIESMLEAHELVERAAVKVFNPDSPNAQLIAFVGVDQQAIFKAGPSARMGASSILKRHLSEQLPKYKLPTAILVEDRLPLTSSGKVDRQRLPDQLPPAAITQQCVPPSNALEEYLVAQWCQLLELETVSVDQNFFDAGGSSLQAAMLTSQLSDELQFQVPTALLFDLANIQQIAARLVELHPAEIENRFGLDCVTSIRQSGQTESAPHDSLLSPLKPSGSRPPIFMVHPPGGIVVCYRELALQLPEDQPLFGIRSHGLHGKEDLPPTLEAMASAYLEAIRSTQPSGPYVIGGWSLGGLIAFEIAQQLRREGQQVDRLLLLDTTIPQGSTALVPPSELVNVGREYGIEMTLEQLGELPPEEQLPFLWEHAKKLGVLDDQSPPEVVAKALEDLQSLFHHHVSVSSEYKIEPIDVSIELFRPTEVPFELRVSEDRGWSNLASQVNVHFTPGHHHSMVQPPHVGELATKLIESLKPAD